MNKKEHWRTKNSLRSRWLSMQERCYNKNHISYKNYGARGITVCEEWKESYDNFKEWSESNGYQLGLTLDRIDNDRGYSPDNCRWTDGITQANNKRNNVKLTAFGETKTLTEWSRDYRCPVTLKLLQLRIARNMEHEKAISMPKLTSSEAAMRNTKIKNFEAWGESKPMREWVIDERCKVTRKSIEHRLERGFSLEEAMSTPNLKN